MSDDIVVGLVPVVGTFFFLLGVPILFVASAGRWRVRRWPRFCREDRNPEPFRQRVGNATYFCADVAMFTGLGAFIVGLLVVAGVSFL